MSEPVFIQVGELAEGFAPNSHILQPVNELEGCTFDLNYEDGSTDKLHFPLAQTVEVVHTSSAAVNQTQRREKHACRVTSVRNGIYFVDYIGADERLLDDAGQPRAATTSYVLDLHQKLCTTLIGTLPSETETHIDAFTRVERGLELSAVQVQFRHGRIAVEGDVATAEAPLHAPTRDLIGKRVQYAYSATELYEHIYLNDNFYAWHCLSGVELGLADVDRCHTIGIDTNLYLFVWREKVIPTLGVVMIDLERMKTDGKLFGYQGNNFDSLSNFPVGAHAQVLNVTKNPL